MWGIAVHARQGENETANAVIVDGRDGPARFDDETVCAWESCVMVVIGLVEAVGRAIVSSHWSDLRGDWLGRMGF